MKQRICLLTTLAMMLLTANAQDDVLSVEFLERVPAQLDGKAGVIFTAESNDYTIESSANETVSTAQRVGNHYEYKLLITLPQGMTKDSRVFTVKKNATPFSGKSPQKYVEANNYSYYSIKEIKTKLGANETVSSGTYLKEKGNTPRQACVEITMPDELGLKVNVSKALNAQKDSIRKSGNMIYTIVFDTNRFKELEDIVAGLKKKEQELDSKLENLKDEAARKQIFDQQDQLEKDKPQAEANLANASVITITGDGVNTLVVDANKIKSLRPKDQLLYGVLVVEKEVMKEYSYNELLEIARKRYAEYPQHSDFNFYDGAMTAYKQVKEHKDCPDAMRPTLQAEYDSIVNMRKWVNFYERAGRDAAAAGHNTEAEYKFMAAQLRSINRLLKYHPEITAFNSIKQSLRERIRQHPMGRQTVQRQKVSGMVSFADPDDAEPFSKLRIYASPTEKVDPSRSRQVGTVKADGSFSVVIPDYMAYLYVSGEKKGHWIGDGRTVLDIVVRY